MFARPGLPAFDYVRATTPDEVVRLLQEHGPAARLLMGGTDLFPNLRDGKLCPRLVVDVKGLPGMRDVAFDPGIGLSVGAAVTMNELARHPAVQTHYPLLAQAAESVASYQVRNRATIGGNLCNASPCADTAPATLVLEAELVLYGPAGERVVPAAHFFIGPGKTVLRPAELLMA
ncbi:MAG: FAD binding domain-containing protein, partial [candidate division KSB1 bacterium]|nr:FAD binding domain-containing protein [candidate division KSB1 bacterium]